MAKVPQGNRSCQNRGYLPLPAIVDKIGLIWGTFDLLPKTQFGFRSLHPKINF